MLENADKPLRRSWITNRKYGVIGLYRGQLSRICERGHYLLFGNYQREYILCLTSQAVCTKMKLVS